MWRWDQAEPFGNTPANEDPDANSVAFDLPLRLPGQRYDAETGLHYNYFRDYDPSTGRYQESDPIGLDGGDLNTYRYVASTPLTWTDIEGLRVQSPTMGNGPGAGWGGIVTGIGGLGGGAAISNAINSKGDAESSSSSSSSSESSASCLRDNCGKMLEDCEIANATKKVKIPCFACFQQCQGQGKWPNHIPLWTTIPGNYKRSCAYW